MEFSHVQMLPFCLCVSTHSDGQQVPTLPPLDTLKMCRTLRIYSFLFFVFFSYSTNSSQNHRQINNKSKTHWKCHWSD